MAPPTAASESILVLRRNAAPVDFHGAFAPHPKNYPMETNENKLRKIWGERWSVTKGGKLPAESQMIETSNFMVHPDYLNKYGTLSNGVLTKSIKYAETWLYGTVGVRAVPTQRPSLFLYPGVVTSQSRMGTKNGYHSPVGPFINAPVSPENNIQGVAGSRVHVDQCNPRLYQCSEMRTDNFIASKKKNGTCRNTVRQKIRTSLRDSGTGSVRSPRNCSLATDPYNLMRKSRLSVTDSPKNQIVIIKRRNASVSPLRSQARENTGTTFETFKPSLTGKEVTMWKNEEEEWTKPVKEITRRKSILECNVNAYELNKSKSEEEDDSGDEIHGKKSEKVEPASLKILRPKHNKTEVPMGSGEKMQDPENGKMETDQLIKSEARLHGQRFKLFDHSPSPTGEGYLSDNEEARKTSSPKRPPRRQKERAFGEPNLRYSKIRFQSSPNLSIKSILKKPTSGEEVNLLEQAFEREPPSTSSSLTVSKSDGTHLQLLEQSKKDYTQCTLKKKKQVQFRVNRACDTGNEGTVEGSDAFEPKSPPVEPKEETDVDHTEDEAFVDRSKSHEDLANLPRVTKDCSQPNESQPEMELLTNDEVNCGDRKLSDDDPATRLNEQEKSPPRGPGLRRSLSDRRLTSCFTSHKDDTVLPLANSSAVSLFNDTMALRSRTSKSDTRKIFLTQLEANENDRGKKEKTASKTGYDNLGNFIGHNNAVKKFPGNVISYEEFTKLCDFPGKQEENITKSKSNVPARRKTSCPSPPPRHVPLEKSVKNSMLPVTLNVSSNRTNLLKSSTSCPAQSNSTAVEGKTVVRLGSGYGESVTVGGSKRPSITIHPKNVLSEEEPRRKTSVIISNFHGEDANKVRISVRNEGSDAEGNSSSCTIIETGSNSTVIPVVSTDNKTTLIVGSNTPVVAADSEIDLLSSFDKNETCTDEKLSRYIFSTVQLDADKTAKILDPVEAVRRNLIPHICGKKEGSISLMERIKQARETKEQNNLKQISNLFIRSASPQEAATEQLDSLISSYINRKSIGKSEPEEHGNASKIGSCRSSHGKNLDSAYICTHAVSESNNKLNIPSDTDESTEQEKDKLECEYEVRNGLKEDDIESENVYEMIKEEPIYHQIEPKVEENQDSGDDVPPPLPLTLPPASDDAEKQKSATTAKSIFEGASKYDILNYLVDAKERVQGDSYCSGGFLGGDERLNSFGRHKRMSLDTSGLSSSRGTLLNLDKTHGFSLTSVENDNEIDSGSRISQMSYLSDDGPLMPANSEKEPLKLARKSSAEIERNDSGVGSETSQTSRSKWQASSTVRDQHGHHLCEDCDQIVETQVTDGGVMYVPLVCRKCGKKRSERKEIIQEIVETEEKYGRDLRIILEEFYTPMLVAGLLTSDQLSSIFLNTEELLENSEVLTERLRDTLEIALEQGDEDLLTVNVGKLFLDAEPMLHAFESYCVRQGSAALLLANLEKEKELLRIFLRVSQMENVVLRRMNLNSFLMVPVQRVTKYPLLLARLYKVTPAQQEGRELLKEAQHNIELHLEHMNSETKDASATKVWRRFSTSTMTGRKTTTESEMVNIKLRKMAVDVLDWNHDEVRFILEGKLLYTQPTDNNWKRGRTVKLTPIFVLLITLGKPNSKYKVDPSEDELTFHTKTGIREATLLLVKEKCGRYTLIREPLYLDKIIVCCETEVDEYFEIQELSTKDSFIFKAEDGERTKEWYKQLQYHAQILGAWRKRRNALANIMINGMMTRAGQT
ncbi:hypothetical protein RUM44_003219 [Polyplax serrata]|uniref:Myosin-M heavy chain n=1 Tax=Polyplax serrata TaxID=468196 RepID=A0ABR1AXZ6_POLSC